MKRPPNKTNTKHLKCITVSKLNSDETFFMNPPLLLPPSCWRFFLRVVISGSRRWLRSAVSIRRVFFCSFYSKFSARTLGGPLRSDVVVCVCLCSSVLRGTVFFLYTLLARSVCVFVHSLGPRTFTHACLVSARARTHMQCVVINFGSVHRSILSEHTYRFICKSRESRIVGGSEGDLLAPSQSQAPSGEMGEHTWAVNNSGTIHRT